MSDEFEGEILNLDSVEIDLPFGVLKRLKKPHLLERDPQDRLEADLWKRVWAPGDLGRESLIQIRSH